MMIMSNVPEKSRQASNGVGIIYTIDEPAKRPKIFTLGLLISSAKSASFLSECVLGAERRPSAQTVEFVRKAVTGIHVGSN